MPNLTTGPANSPAPTPGTVPANGSLTIERMLAFDAGREYRLDPRQRWVAYTQEASGARQLFLLPLRGGPVVQLSASDKPISDPQWAPDGRRLAFVRDGAIWLIDVDGSRQVEVTAHAAGNSQPRWSPDGGRLAFISRRRGWSQVWLVDAPIPRRGRPASHPRPAEPTALTPAGLDVEDIAWSPDGSRLALVSQREADGWTSAISIADVASGHEQRIDARGAWECGLSWLPDGGLLFTSDASGWFQVVRLEPDLRTRVGLTAGSEEHGEPMGGYGMQPLASPDGRWFSHIAVHDGQIDLVVAPLAAPARPDAGQAIQPWPGVWRAIGWTADGNEVVAIGESERHPQDLWLLPVPGSGGAQDRPRPLTDALPAVLRPTRWAEPERIRFDARDGLPIEATLWRPAGASGPRGADRVPAVVYTHGGPTGQNLRSWQPFQQLLAREGFRRPRRGLPRLDRLRASLSRGKPG